MAGREQWPIVTAGVSGGGGYASFNGLKLLQEHADLIGILLAVSPHNPTRFTSKVSVPAGTLHNVPIFMSAGDSDQTATKAVTDGSHHELTNAGFKKVRYEHFSGGHHLYQPHLEEALDWFLEENKGTSPPPR